MNHKHDPAVHWNHKLLNKQGFAYNDSREHSPISPSPPASPNLNTSPEPHTRSVSPECEWRITPDKLSEAVKDYTGKYRHISPLRVSPQRVTILEEPRPYAQRPRQYKPPPRKEKAYIVPPFKRHPTTYVDVVPGKRRGREDKKITSLPGKRRYLHAQSRVMNHLPPRMELKKDHKIVIRNTRLCYAVQKYTQYRCDHDHFKVMSEQVRNMDQDHRRLMWMQRQKEIGDHRGTAAYNYGLRLRRQAREEAYASFEEASQYLRDLDELDDPMDKERELAYWQLEVANRRLEIADAMDDIDLQIELSMEQEAHASLTKTKLDPKHGRTEHTKMGKYAAAVPARVSDTTSDLSGMDALERTPQGGGSVDFGSSNSLASGSSRLARTAPPQQRDRASSKSEIPYAQHRFSPRSDSYPAASEARGVPSAGSYTPPQANSDATPMKASNSESSVDEIEAPVFKKGRETNKASGKDKGKNIGKNRNIDKEKGKSMGKDKGTGKNTPIAKDEGAKKTNDKEKGKNRDKDGSTGKGIDKQKGKSARRDKGDSAGSDAASLPPPGSGAFSGSSSRGAPYGGDAPAASREGASRDASAAPPPSAAGDSDNASRSGDIFSKMKSMFRSDSSRSSLVLSSPGYSSP